MRKPGTGLQLHRRPSLQRSVSSNADELIKIEESNEQDQKQPATGLAASMLATHRGCSQCIRDKLLGLRKWLRQLCCKTPSQTVILDAVQLQRYLRKLRTLPPQQEVRVPGKAEKLLVINLDGLLVRSASDQRNSDFTIEVLISQPEISGSKRKHPLAMQKRFGVEYFLREMSLHYSLVVLATSTEAEAEQIVSNIDPDKRVAVVLGKSHCTRINNILAKNLSMFGKQLSSVVLLDNLEQAASIHPENHVYVRSFNGNEKDRELIKVIPFLKYLAKREDVRPVEDHRLNFEQTEIQIVEEGGVKTSRLVSPRLKLSRRRGKSGDLQAIPTVTLPTLETQASRLLMTKYDTFASESSETECQLTVHRS